MNDPANLSLYSELVRFQADHSKLEVRFSYPSNEMQRILQSFAHGLGLEYEYFLDSREARITRAIVLTSEPVLGPSLAVARRRGLENISGGSSNIYTNKASDQQRSFISAPTDNSGPTFELDCLDFGWTSCRTRYSTSTGTLMLLSRVYKSLKFEPQYCMKPSSHLLSHRMDSVYCIIPRNFTPLSVKSMFKEMSLEPSHK
jgi:hypothetical protein